MIIINDTEIIAEIVNTSTGIITHLYAESYFELHLKLKKLDVFTSGYNNFLDYIKLLTPKSQDEHFIMYSFVLNDFSVSKQSQTETIPQLQSGITLPISTYKSVNIRT